MARKVWEIKESVIEIENLWNLVEPVAVEAAKHAIENKYDPAYAATFVKDAIMLVLNDTFGQILRGTPQQVSSLRNTIDRLVVRSMQNA